MNTNPVGHKCLESWDSLNEYLMKSERTKEECEKIMDIEMAHRNRQQFIKRIHSRLNKVRADFERSKLGIS
jgi:hypothetical protein